MAKRIDLDLLRDLNNNDVSLGDIADKFAVTKSAICNAMKRNNIKPNWRLGSEYIVNEYISGRGAPQIAAEVDATTSGITRLLKRNGVLIRPINERRISQENYLVACSTYINKEWLTEQYVVNKRSARDIARECGAGHATIYKYIDKYNIERNKNLVGIKDIFEQKFGRLVAIYPERYRKNGSAVWFCRCSCGNSTSVGIRDLCSGHTRSCGCLSIEIATERILQISENSHGENSPNWNPNLTEEERQIRRNYPEYREWREAVYARDGYICQKCGEKASGKLNAHHIESYDTNKDLRTMLENGVTLCKDCHDNFHHIYGRGNNTREQFDEFMLMGDCKDAIS